MAPAMFVPWRGDWTSEKTGIHPPFKCSHTRLLFTPTTKQPVPIRHFSCTIWKSSAESFRLGNFFARFVLLIRNYYINIFKILPVICVLFINMKDVWLHIHVHTHTYTWKLCLFIPGYRFFNLEKRIRRQKLWNSLLINFYKYLIDYLWLLNIINMYKISTKIL